MAQLAFQVKVNVPDGLVPDMRDTLALEWGYQETVPDPASTLEVPLPDIPNPQTKIQFVIAHIRQRTTAETADYVRNTYKNAKSNQIASLTVDPDLS
jgi:hypothetical protein